MKKIKHLKLKNKSIFVACDTSDLKEIKKILQQTKNRKLKIHTIRN